MSAAIQEYGSTELYHPSFSLELTPSDFYLFSKLKSDLRGEHVNTNDEMKSAILAHFEDTNPDYFSEGMKMLVKRYEKCIPIKGNYIEK